MSSNPANHHEDFSRLTADELVDIVFKQPLNIELHRLMFTRRHEQGDELAALAHLIAANAIEAHTSGIAADAGASVEFSPARQLYMVATGYFMKGDYAIAERWYQLVLMLAPDMAEVYQNSVVIHLHFGRVEEAEKCRARAYELQRVFIDPIKNPVRQLLILCVGRTTGNIPYEVLLSAEKSQRIKYIIDYAEDAEDNQLPLYDLVFNAIGEPDVAAPLTARLERFMARCHRPVMNRPESIAKTQRHQLKSLLSGIPHVQTANCCRIEPGELSHTELARRLADEHIEFPVLVRPVEMHGGQGLVRCAYLNEVSEQLKTNKVAHYLSNFVDVKSTDGFYRKYRVIYVDKKPYAYHLAISSQWMAHYHTSDMTGFPWKIAEEKRFLQETVSVLGKKGITALIDIGQRLNLEYAGIDFTILPDGQLFIFEANATMLVHRVNNHGVLAYKNTYIQKIADAFEALQINTMANPSNSSNPV